MSVRTRLRALLLGVALVLGCQGTARAQSVAQTPGAPIPGTAPSPGMSWYGWSVNGLLGGLYIAGTHPFYAVGDWSSTSMMAPSPTLYPLSSTDGYHNGMEYIRAMLVSNGIRTTTLLNQQALDTKESVDPLLGKTTGLSFWQWVKFGQQSLKVYGKAASIVRALKSGTVKINIWKLVPKVDVIDQDNPAAPMMQLGLVPSSSGAIAMAKDIIQVNDPRFYGGNLIQWNEIQTLVPSLGVTPSFYGAYAHMNQADPNAQQQLMMAAIQRNFHEMRLGLSMIRRGVMGRAENENDIKRNRFSTPSARFIGDQMKAVNASYWTDLSSELTRGARLLSPDLGTKAAALTGSLNQAQAAENDALDTMIQTKAADTWQAKRIAGNVANITGGLESDDYMKAVKKVEDLIHKYASADATPATADDQKMQLGLAVADAWTNKLIFDEMKAMRQIYAARVEQEGIERLAPIIAQSQDELETARRRLRHLQSMVNDMAGYAPSSSSFFNGDDVSRVIIKMDVKP